MALVSVGACFGGRGRERERTGRESEKKEVSRESEEAKKKKNNPDRKKKKRKKKRNRKNSIPPVVPADQQKRRAPRSLSRISANAPDAVTAHSAPSLPGEHGGEVGRGVEVALGARAVPKVRDGHVPVLEPAPALLPAQRVGGAHGLRELRGQRRRDRVERQRPRPVVDRHLPPLPRLQLVAKALVGKVAEREAAVQEHALLPVLREDRVRGLQGGGGADGGGLLARGGHVEREAPLPLRLVEHRVHRLQPRDRRVERDRLRFVQVVVVFELSSRISTGISNRSAGSIRRRSRAHVVAGKVDGPVGRQGPRGEAPRRRGGRLPYRSCSSSSSSVLFFVRRCCSPGDGCQQIRVERARGAVARAPDKGEGGGVRDADAPGELDARRRRS